METFQFGPGEENAERILRRLLKLEELLLQLKQRTEVDGLVIGALLAQHEEPSELRERWRQLVAGYYPSQLMDYQSLQGIEAPRQELKSRIDFWTEVLEARCRRSSDSD